MKFALDDEQRLFGNTLDKLLSGSGVPDTGRAWAAGEHARGIALWRALAEAGVFALAVPESAGGLGVLPVELVTAFRAVGAHGVPGPYAETVAAACLLARLTPAGGWLPGITQGTTVASVAIPPDVPYALDADAADVVLAVDGRTLRHGVPAAMRPSLDPARRLFTVTPGDVLASVTSADVTAAYDLGVLACAAQLSGIGERLLAVTVEYAKTRQQFGRPIGEFQAVKHHLANAFVALEYARPLVYGAALAYGTADFSREASAAKAATADATYLASRIGLQVHGAIGYTDEYDPSLLIRKARALRGAWGAPSAHKARVLSSLSGGGTDSPSHVLAKSNIAICE
ncbi:MAG TPA: acyl-CoA dehydrogenase family protein [Trebonia sp.]|jgi:alkylation response protein AidB-like acyl-CoA dehydrogenase|nr:acyl-CoA dehydrogenase family protein [Trebonia sp.]